MTLNPEAQILLINAALLLVAYELIYPGIRGVTSMEMVKIDLLLTGLGLVIAGVLFWGEGIRFSMLLFSTNWVVFSVLTFALMEMPLYIWFCRDRGLNPFSMEDDES